MVSLKAARVANTSLPKQSPSIVFFGATSGTGLGAIEASLRCCAAPKIIIIGRSATKFASTLQRLRTLNGAASIEFIEAQVSLLKEVARVSHLVRAQLPTLDLLWLSQGGLAPMTHSLTSEGVCDEMAINYYSRMLAVHLLLPLLEKAQKPRIVSVYCAGQEGEVNVSDLGLKDPANYGVFSAMKHTVMLTSLVMHYLSQQSPRVSFLHTNPGMVSTGVHDKWIKSMTGPWAIVGKVANWTIVPFFHSLGYSPEQAGELGFYELTDARYGIESGSNFLRLDENAETVKVCKKMVEYEKEGLEEKVWAHTLRVFEEVVGEKV